MIPFDDSISTEQCCIPFTDHVRGPDEFQLVVACSWRSNNIEQQNILVESLAAANLDWENVARLVILHGTIGTFCSVMSGLGWANVPLTIKERFKSLRFQQAAQSLKQAVELGRICNKLLEAGVSVLPLKGVTLSHQLYGDSTVRACGDIDLLVKQEDVERSELFLNKIGYQKGLKFHGFGEKQRQYIIKSFHHHEYLNLDSSSHLELHWRSFLWSDTQMTALWTDSVESEWMNNQIRQLSTVDNMLFLADHGARHGWQSLKWLSDLAMIRQNSSVEMMSLVYARASSFGLQRVMLHTELLLNRLYGLTLSSQASMLLQFDRTIKPLTESTTTRLIATSQSSEQPERINAFRQVALLKQLRPAASIWGLIKQVVILPTDFVEFPLPNYLFWLYIPLRPILWFRRHYLHR